MRSVHVRQLYRCVYLLRWLSDLGLAVTVQLQAADKISTVAANVMEVSEDAEHVQAALHRLADSLEVGLDKADAIVSHDLEISWTAKHHSSSSFGWRAKLKKKCPWCQSNSKDFTPTAAATGLIGALQRTFTASRPRPKPTPKIDATACW